MVPTARAIRAVPAPRRKAQVTQRARSEAAPRERAGRFPRLHGVGGGIEVSNQTVVSFAPHTGLNQSLKPPAGVSVRAPSGAEGSAALQAGAVASRALSEFDDLYQFLWYCVFFAGFAGLIVASVRAVRNAT